MVAKRQILKYVSLKKFKLIAKFQSNQIIMLVKSLIEAGRHDELSQTKVQE
tara:strand:+ start:144 stop:296 length:153 start_codon:yes stop_codon:yes gene_type:complete